MISVLQSPTTVAVLQSVYFHYGHTHIFAPLSAGIYRTWGGGRTSHTLHIRDVPPFLGSDDEQDPDFWSKFKQDPVFWFGFGADSGLSV